MKVKVAVLLSMSAVWLVAAPQNPRPGEKNPLAGDPAAIAAGAELFARSCASCHLVESRAPSLATGRFARGGEDDQIAQTIRAGVPGSQMPAFPALRTDAVWQLVAYIRSLSNAGPVAAGAGGGGDAVAGDAIFNGKGGCAACHQVNARGGIVGPDLSAAGTRSPEALRQAILNPGSPAASGRGGAAARPVVIVAKTRDGREIRGVRRSEDTFSVHIMDVSGQLHLLDKAALADVQYEDRSLMPGDYETRLSAAASDLATSAVPSGELSSTMINCQATPPSARRRRSIFAHSEEKIRPLQSVQDAGRVVVLRHPGGLSLHRDHQQWRGVA